MTVRAVVRGVGHYLPERVVPNSNLNRNWTPATLGYSALDQAAAFRGEGQTTSDMAIEAAKAALNSDLHTMISMH